MKANKAKNFVDTFNSRNSYDSKYEKCKEILENRNEHLYREVIEAEDFVRNEHLYREVREAEDFPKWYDSKDDSDELPF